MFLGRQKYQSSQIGATIFLFEKIMDVSLIPYKQYDMTFQIVSQDILPEFKNITTNINSWNRFEGGPGLGCTTLM